MTGGAMAIYYILHNINCFNEQINEFLNKNAQMTHESDVLLRDGAC